MPCPAVAALVDDTVEFFYGFSGGSVYCWKGHTCFVTLLESPVDLSLYSSLSSSPRHVMYILIPY